MQLVFTFFDALSYFFIPVNFKKKIMQNRITTYRAQLNFLSIGS